METNKPKTGRNTTAITNPKTKSQNTTANTKSATSKSATGKSAEKQSGGTGNTQNQAASKNAKSGFGRNAAGAASPSKSLLKSSGMTAGGASKSPSKSPSQGGAAGQSWSKPSSKAGAKMEASNEFCRLKDFDIASDVLGGQKSLLKLYGTALCETDCPNLRNLINTQLSEVAVDQFDIFTYMNQRGMYPTEQAPAGKLKQAVTKYNQKAVFKNNQK